MHPHHVIPAIVFVITGILVPFAPPVPAGSKDPGRTQLDQSPFACNVDALTPKEQDRHFKELGPMLRSIRKDVHDLKNGYEFQSASDGKTYQRVSEWAEQGSRCCPFFRIELRLKSGGGPLWLKLTGREGAKEFIRTDMANWIRRSLQEPRSIVP